MLVSHAHITIKNVPRDSQFFVCFGVMHTGGVPSELIIENSNIVSWKKGGLGLAFVQRFVNMENGQKKYITATHQSDNSIFIDTHIPYDGLTIRIRGEGIRPYEFKVRRREGDYDIIIVSSSTIKDVLYYPAAKEVLDKFTEEELLKWMTAGEEIKKPNIQSLQNWFCQIKKM